MLFCYFKPNILSKRLLEGVRLDPCKELCQNHVRVHTFPTLYVHLLDNCVSFKNGLMVSIIIINFGTALDCIEPARLLITARKPYLCKYRQKLDTALASPKIMQMT